MYTFQALATIDTLNDHTGFYFIAVMSTVIAMLIVMFEDEVEMVRMYVWIAIITTALAGTVSYNTGSVTTYANKQVSATLVGFQAEGYSVTERSGKTTRQVDKHNTYVVYAVPAGSIMFPAAPGQVYPRSATLYLN
jgi:hypothetical protein